MGFGYPKPQPLHRSNLEMNFIKLFLLLSSFSIAMNTSAGELSPRTTVIQISKYKTEGHVSIHAEIDIDTCYWLEIPEADQYMLSMALSAYAAGLPVRIQLDTNSCVISRFVNEK